MSSTDRRLADGFRRPAMLRDLDGLGIRGVAQLAHQNPGKLYQRLCRKTGQPLDLCCFDAAQPCPKRAIRVCRANNADLVVLEPQAQGPRCPQLNRKPAA